MATLVPAFLLTQAFPISGQSEDARWDFRFGFPGADSAVTASTLHEGELVVAGGFSSIGATKAAFAARWDGEHWRALGPGLDQYTRADSMPYALTSWDGDLFLGGSFWRSNPTAALFRWDGIEWLPFDGITGVIHSLKHSSDALYLGGKFSFPGDTNTFGVARWNGAQWDTLGSIIAGTPDSFGNWGVYWLAVNESEIFASGRFLSIAGQGVSSGAHWDGTNWFSFPLGGPITMHQGQLHGSRYLYSTNGDYAPRIGRWDGMNWNLLGDGFSHVASDLFSEGTNLYTCGDFTNSGPIHLDHIARWNGEEWLPLGSPGWGQVEENWPLRIGSDADGGVLAMGWFDQVQEAPATGIAAWGGNAWAPVAPSWVQGMSGHSGFVYALLAEDGMVYGGGSFRSAGFTNVNLIGYFNGEAWNGLGSGLTNSGSAVLCMTRHAGDLIVGGRLTGVAGGTATNLARWDGHQWSKVGDGANANVHAVASIGTELFVGGRFTQVGDASVSYLACWNGSLWNALGSGADGPVRALATDGQLLFVGGEFANAGGISVNGIGCWDGSGWRSLDSGFSGDSPVCTAIHLCGTNLYAGGSFTSAGGILANNVAMWNGGSWSALGGGVTGGAVLAIAAREDRVYVGGSFTNAGGVPAAGLACWDGTAWSALGSGLALTPTLPRVFSLALTPDSLYVGGIFSAAGNSASACIARWVDRPTLQLTEAMPLPSGQTKLSFSGQAGLQVEIEQSVELSGWDPLIEGMGTNDTLSTLQTTAPEQQFYRMKLLAQDP